MTDDDGWGETYEALVALCRQFTAAGWDEDAFVTDSDPRRRTARVELAAPDAGDARRFDERCRTLRAAVEATGFVVGDVRCSRDLRQRSWWLTIPAAEQVVPLRAARSSVGAGSPRRSTGTARARRGTSAPVRSYRRG